MQGGELGRATDPLIQATLKSPIRSDPGPHLEILLYFKQCGWKIPFSNFLTELGNLTVNREFGILSLVTLKKSALADTLQYSSPIVNGSISRIGHT